MQPIAIADAVPVPTGTRGYVTAGNERHTRAGRLPLRSVDRPAPTLVAGGNSRMMRSGMIVPISLREAARLGSWPDDWGWGYEAIAHIGNSVPPRFAQAVAEHLAMTFLGAPRSEPARPLDFIDKPINPPGPYLFTVISLFAGCGGSSLGYKWAGGKVLAAVEWDHNAAETYRLNHHGTPVLERDIKTVMPEELLALTGLQPGELDILDGSPPCQGFSTAGKRNFYDDRNDLFAEYVRLLRGLQPKVFVMENVSGMVKGHMKHIFARIMRELKASGYRVKAQLMNAMYFGVPQSRERVIIIGVREDVLAEPSHPAAMGTPTHAGIALNGVPAAPVRAISLRAAALWDRMAPGTCGSGVSGPNKDFGLMKLAPALPSPTLRAGITAGTGYLHWGQRRFLSMPEESRLASFCDAWQWLTPPTASKRIGNAVPPRFMQAIAEHVRLHVLAPAAAPGPAGQAPGAR